MNTDDEKTLCALVEEGFIDSSTERFTQLIQPAHFYCGNCGRSAVADKNLCNPQSLAQ